MVLLGNVLAILAMLTIALVLLLIMGAILVGAFALTRELWRERRRGW